MIGNNGVKEASERRDYPGGPMFVKEATPMFEKDLMTAGMDVLSTLPVAVFKDDNDANIACLYLGTLKLFGLEDALEIALWRINATMAIQGRAREDSLQAHARIAFLRNIGKEDKQRLAEMQQIQRVKDNNNGGGGMPPP